MARYIGQMNYADGSGYRRIDAQIGRPNGLVFEAAEVTAANASGPASVSPLSRAEASTPPSSTGRGAPQGPITHGTSYCVPTHPQSEKRCWRSPGSITAGDVKDRFEVALAPWVPDADARRLRR